MPDPVKLIIDTDPGIDDAMAIFHAAAAPDIDLLGLTSIFGNVTTAKATRNALRLVEAAGLHCPVARGAERPLVLPPFPPSAKVHGEEGFGDIPAEEPTGRAVGESAAAFLVRMARNHAGELVVCPIGPLTNIAEALRLDPDFARNVKRIVIMGGSLEDGGNITPYAEANIYHDPHAADEVFASGAPITLVGLDVTHQILCPAEDFAGIAADAPRLGGMLQEMSRFYLRFYESVGKFGGCSLHDPAAVIACAHPELFTTRPVPLCVVCEGAAIGATVADESGTRLPVEVCMGVQAEAVKQVFRDTLALLP
ncbi:nucleoside hydrolase [Nioella nitratireducens]|uniref:nucleoside hydrolase n=1 Tax=Nioella nitratireducens TaxID=1287720 RepID=UPI0008FD49E7|nr:nucleoside hydrolase [Nioella nitratireducens]